MYKVEDSELPDYKQDDVDGKIVPEHMYGNQAYRELGLGDSFMEHLDINTVKPPQTDDSVVDYGHRCPPSHLNLAKVLPKQLPRSRSMPDLLEYFASPAGQLLKQFSSDSPEFSIYKLVENSAEHGMLSSDIGLVSPVFIT